LHGYDHRSDHRVTGGGGGGGGGLFKKATHTGRPAKTDEQQQQK